MLSRLTENPILMSRVVDSIEAGGVNYTYSDKERKAAEILGADNIINPALTQLAWTYVAGVQNPEVKYSEDTLLECEDLNKVGMQYRKYSCPLYWKWKLVYVHGLSVREQIKSHGGHFSQWSESKKQWFLDNDKAEWMSKTHNSGYYLINYTTLENGGNDYRAIQDKLLEELGAGYARLPISILSETALSLHYALGEKHSDFGYAWHWSDQRSIQGNFLSLEVKVDGRIHEKTLRFNLDDSTPGKSWAGDAFVGRHGMCVYRKHEW
jgi:hypothetical protein